MYIHMEKRFRMGQNFFDEFMFDIFCLSNWENNVLAIPAFETRANIVISISFRQWSFVVCCRMCLPSMQRSSRSSTWTPTTDSGMSTRRSRSVLNEWVGGLLLVTDSLFISVVDPRWCGSGSGCGSGFEFLFDADLDPSFHPDEDPDPDPSFQIKAQTLEEVLKLAIFHTFWLVICKLMRIRIRFRIQLLTLMRIRIRIRIFIWCGCGSGLPKWCGSGSTTLLSRAVAWYLEFLTVRSGDIENPGSGSGPRFLSTKTWRFTNLFG